MKKANVIHAGTIKYRVLAILLVFVLVFGLIPQQVLVASADTELGALSSNHVAINMSYQADDSGFWIARQSFDVAADLSENYGYVDAYEGKEVTALDAIVAAHIAVFGEEISDVNAALEVTSGGFLSSFMGDGTGSFVYFVDGKLLEIPAGETVLDDDDFVQLFSIQDLDLYSDAYAWFEIGGQKTEQATALVGKPLDINVSGTLFAIYGDYGAYDDVLDGASIVPVTVEDGVGYFGEPLTVTDDDGNATVTFTEPGTYILSAIDTTSTLEMPLMSPWLVVTVTEPKSTINMSYQADDTNIKIARRPFTVTANLSEKYGYNDAYGGTEVTALDAIVAAHIAVFGEEIADVNAALEVMDSGYLSNFMSTGTGNFVYFIDHELLNDAAGDTLLEDDNLVELFSIQDLAAWSDAYAWFEINGQKTEQATAVASQPLDINVSGTLCAIYGEYGAYDDVLSGAGIVPVTVEDGVGNLGEPLAVTDADGNTTVTFAEAGTYILSAIDVTSASKMPLMSPWLVVTVTDDEIAPPVADKTALNKTIARAIKLVESDYTSETWQPFKSALTNAQGIANSDTATQTQVNKAETTLAAAISSLILATDDKGGDSKVKLPPLKDVTKALDSLDAYQTSTAKNPTFGNEWIVLALARNGAISDDYTQKYLENLVTTLKESDGVLSTSKYTEYARVIIALSALGIDAHDVGGYDLLANLYDYDKVVKQGVNGAAYALIALDAASTATKVSTLSVKETQTQSLKNKLIQFILDKQLSDGGWSLGSPKSDPDTTSMVLQALTPYISTDKKIKNTVDKAILTLSGLQNSKTAGYGTCESDAQVMTALNTLKIPLNDVRFAKNGKTLYDDLMTYYIPSQGAFKHTLSGKANGIATEQANYALVSLYRALTGAKPLYDMSDVATYDDTLPSGKDTQPGGKQNPSGGKQGESGSEQNQPNNQNEYNENPNNGNIPNETNSGNEQNSGTTGDTGASSASNLTRVYSNAAGQNRLLSNAEALAGELAKDTVANAANAANAADTADAAETEASIGATSKEKTAARDAIPESQEPKVSGDTTKSDAENGLPIRTVIGIIAGLIAIALIVFLVMQNRKKAKLVK